MRSDHGSWQPLLQEEATELGLFSRLKQRLKRDMSVLYKEIGMMVLVAGDGDRRERVIYTKNNAGPKIIHKQSMKTLWVKTGDFLLGVRS